MASLDTFAAEVPKTIIKDKEFLEWVNQIDNTEYIKIEAAIAKIEESGIITSTKSLGDGLYEKKWNSGLRLYFAIILKNGKKTLLLLGSKKGIEQDKSIKKSKKLLANYEVYTKSIKLE